MGKPLYTWKARYKNGEILEQFEGKQEHTFNEIEQDRLEYLEVYKDGEVKLVVPFPKGYDLIICQVGKINFYGYKRLLNGRCYKNLFGIRSDGLQLLLNETT